MHILGRRLVGFWALAVVAATLPVEVSRGGRACHCTHASACARPMPAGAAQPHRGGASCHGMAGTEVPAVGCALTSACCQNHTREWAGDSTPAVATGLTLLAEAERSELLAAPETAAPRWRTTPPPTPPPRLPLGA